MEDVLRRTELNQLENHTPWSHTLLSISPWDTNTVGLYQPRAQLHARGYLTPPTRTVGGGDSRQLLEGFGLPPPGP
jgi:hypothetical protein